VVPESDEFALDAAMPPTRILPGKSDDQFAQLIINHGPSWPVGVRPFPGDQTAMPRQQRAQRHDAVPAQFAGQQPRYVMQTRPHDPATRDAGG